MHANEITPAPNTHTHLQWLRHWSGLQWAGSTPCVGQGSQLTNSAITQVQIQGLEPAYPKTYPIYELLEWERGLVTGSPWFKATAGFLWRVSVRMQYWRCSKSQKPWTRPATHCNEHLPSKVFWAKGYTMHDSTEFPRPLQWRNMWWRGRKDGAVEWYKNGGAAWDSCDWYKRSLGFIEEQAGGQRGSARYVVVFFLCLFLF